jgi:prepilin-type processing-associated H-X9-DG protein
MRNIGLAAIMYAEQNEGKFPEDLAKPLSMNYMTADVVLCPSTRRPGCILNTLAIVDQLKKSGSTDYVYLGKGLSTASAPDTILLYEPLNNHGGNGMNVLFVDCHVQWLTAAQAQVILKQTAARISPIRSPRSTAPATRPAG